jgi:hypothetical protein
MTLYSRSDLVAVTVPAEGFRGCGTTHSRPVVNGKPADIWTLDCPQCEDHLRHQDHWSTTLSEIPETYDESKAREDFDKRGAKDRDNVLALALARLAGVELPETMRRPMTGNMQPAALVECPAGHGNLPGQKFCGECGVPVHPAVKDKATVAEDADGADGDELPGDLATLHWMTLQKLCRERGLDDTGTKADLLKRLGEPVDA